MWCIVQNDPFFGDSITSTSQAANNIFEHNLLTVFYPQQADPGHPTLYAYLLACTWKIFGRTLWVSHLYSCVWAVLLMLAFRKVARQLLSVEQTNQATVLVLLFPTYLSQSAMMLNTVALMTFFLLAVYGVITQRRWLILVMSALMCMTHLQSLFLLLSLASFDLYRNVVLLKHQPFINWFKNRFIVYVFPVGVFALWLWLHKQHTGWAFVSPQYSDIDEFNTIAESLKALLLIGWRLVDYGLLPFYVLVFYVLFKYKQSRKTLAQWIVLLLPCCIAMAFFLSNTIGHRYFMAFAILMIMATISVVEYFEDKHKTIVFIILALSLFSGNFVSYPGKIIGDATLAYRNYFSIEKTLQQEYGDTVFFSHAPLANSSNLRYLNNTGPTIERINEIPLDQLPIVLQSNVNAEFTQQQIDTLTSTWYGKSYESGVVYATVFLNPKFYPNASVRAFRKPSAFELWFTRLKQQIKHE